MQMVNRLILAALVASLAQMAPAQDKAATPAPAPAPAPTATASAPAETAPQGRTERVTLGWGRFFNNDLLGDRMDRWRTSSYTVSRIRGIEGTTRMPQALGELVEFRVRLEQITPGNLSKPAKIDRRYAGIISIGYHTHAKLPAGEVSLGTDLAVIGPQTGMSALQDYVHDRIGLPDGAASYDNQFGNDAVFSAVGEFGKPVAMGALGHIRPFLEAQAGLENMARLGLDLTLGNLDKDGLMLRDSTTGQRYSAIQGPNSRGLSLTLGADIAAVGSSYLLPASGTVTASQTRKRLRAGLNWQGEKSFVFLGVTRLSREFDQQPEEQTVGSLSLNVRF